MDHQMYMNQAVALAQENVEKGGKPFGAVIVKEHVVVATGINKAAQTGDLTSHAEIEAIRKASSAGKSAMLKEATFYASGHPCPMCLSVIYLAGIKEVYYADTLEEAQKAGLGVSYIYDELKKVSENRSIKLNHLPGNQGLDPLKKWSKNL